MQHISRLIMTLAARLAAAYLVAASARQWQRQGRQGQRRQQRQQEHCKQRSRHTTGTGSLHATHTRCVQSARQIWRSTCTQAGGASRSGRRGYCPRRGCASRRSDYCACPKPAGKMQPRPAACQGISRAALYPLRCTVCAVEQRLQKKPADVPGGERAVSSIAKNREGY